MSRAVTWSTPKTRHKKFIGSHLGASPPQWCHPLWITTPPQSSLVILPCISNTTLVFPICNNPSLEMQWRPRLYLFFWDFPWKMTQNPHFMKEGLWNWPHIKSWRIYCASKGLELGHSLEWYVWQFVHKGIMWNRDGKIPMWTIVKLDGHRILEGH